MCGVKATSLLVHGLSALLAHPAAAVFYKQRTSRFYPSICFALQVVLMRLPFCFAESWVWTFMVGAAVRGGGGGGQCGGKAKASLPTQPC